MSYVLKYNMDTLDIVQIESVNDVTFETLKAREGRILYLYCENKEDIIKTYKAIIREEINGLKADKRALNYKKNKLKLKMKEAEKI